MTDWREHILKKFIPGMAKLTLVSDPDRLLLEEKILKGIAERGFELITYEDHVVFRYIYESRFRSRWDNGEGDDLSVVLRCASQDLRDLPYDLLQAECKLSFSLGELFPNLSYPVISSLNISYIEQLYDAQVKYTPEKLGDEATKDFILRHVFKIAPALIKDPKDLLSVLLRRHYRRKQQIPANLDERFIKVLRQNKQFADWPLEVIVPDSQAFFAFLQERWQAFLNYVTKQKKDDCYGTSSLHFEFPGPEILPFDHQDIQVYIDNLFAEGLLKPIFLENGDVFAQEWFSCGIDLSPEENNRRRIEKLLYAAEEALPSRDSNHEEWLQFAFVWAELTALVSVKPSEEYEERLKPLRAKVDSAIKDWALDRYGSLASLPPAPPILLHHIPRYLARELVNDEHAKIAFVVIDGLALDQWLVLKKELEKQEPSFVFREKAVFAWIPTLTSVSRQSAFAGEPPMCFPDSINTTDKEPILWYKFWENQGLKQNNVAYARGLSDGDWGKISDLLAKPKLRVLGLVVDKVDKIIHGMQLGSAGMLSQIKQWASQGFVLNLIKTLQEEGFYVYLTSDHGNIEAKGIGKPNEGVVADLRGERVRIYPDPVLRARTKERFPESLEWPPIGLPEGYFPLIAPPRTAFTKEGSILISHGGISVEELIVPFVKIDRKDG